MTIKTVCVAAMFWGGAWVICPAMVLAEEPAAPVAVKGLPPVDEEQAIKFAKSLIAAIQAGESTQRFLDWTALIDRSAAGLDVPLGMKTGFRQGVQKSVGAPEGLFGQIRKQIELGGSYKFIRVYTDADGTRIKIRLLPASGGVNFHDFLIQEVRGQVIAVDFKIALAGEDFSQIMRRFLIPLVAQENRGILERLTAQESALIKHLGDLQAITKAVQEGHPEEVAGIVSRLPEEVRNEKLCLLQELHAAQALGENDKMESIIARYRRIYPNDPAVDMLSIDYFALKKQLDQALLSAERFRKSTGDEAYMLTMIADLQWQLGNLKHARASVDKAIEREPDFLNAHWTLVAIALSQKEYTTVRKTLQRLTTDFAVVLDPQVIRTEPTYAEFVKSPEFDRLLKFIEAR